MADWLDAHPDVGTYMGDRACTVAIIALSAAELASIGRQMAPCTKEYGEHVVSLWRDFGPGVALRAYASSSKVCERVQVGTERVTVQATSAEELPEDALSPRAREVWEYETERPVFETRCAPSLLALGE